MRNKLLFILAAAVAAGLGLSSCGKDVVYELPDGDKFDNLYFVQAASNPQSFTMKTNQEGSVVKSFSAYYSGMSAPKDIRITFVPDASLVDEYNKANSTSYQPLPESCYEISVQNAVIKAGECRTGLIDIDFRVTQEMELFVTYLLPVRLVTDDVKIRDDLRTLYYTVSLTKDFSPVPIGGKVDPCDEFMMFSDKCLLTRNMTSGALVRYPFDKEAMSFGTGETLQAGWTAAGAVRMCALGRGGTIQYVSVYQGWYASSLGEDASSVPDWVNYQSFITAGCGIFLGCISGHSDGFLAIDMATGGIRYYQLTENGMGLTMVTSFDTKFNYWPYKIRFVYDDDIYGVDTGGVLWRHEYDPASHTWATPERKGSGWGAFTHVTALGSDLIVRSSDGSLSMYEFDPRFVWDLN